MSDVRIILTTVGVQEKAEQLSRALVERGLAACVNIVGPIRSIYRWKGKVENEQEFLLIIKTTEARTPEFAAAFGELHSYELPEQLEIGSLDGSAAYLEWVREQTRRSGQ